MSANHDNHAADHAHHEIEMPHASMRDYAIGFVLSVILTAIPFWMVMTMPLSAGVTAAIIMGFAVVQIVVRRCSRRWASGSSNGASGNMRWSRRSMRVSTPPPFPRRRRPHGAASTRRTTPIAASPRRAASVTTAKRWFRRSPIAAPAIG